MRMALKKITIQLNINRLPMKTVYSLLLFIIVLTSFVTSSYEGWSSALTLLIHLDMFGLPWAGSYLAIPVNTQS